MFNVSILSTLTMAGLLLYAPFPLTGQILVQQAPPRDGAGINVNSGANVLRRSSIPYPAGAIRKRVEGTVAAQLTVDAAGEVTDARILSGPEDLRKVVLQSVLDWRYSEDLMASRIIQVTVNFRLPPAIETREPVAAVNVRLGLGEVFRVGGGVTAPRILRKVDPVYSALAKQEKYQGTVVLEAIIRRDGTVEIVKVVRSLGMGLDEQAIDALRQWTFEPGTRDGEPVNVSLNIEVHFNLR